MRHRPAQHKVSRCAGSGLQAGIVCDHELPNGHEFAQMWVIYDHNRHNGLNVAANQVVVNRHRPLIPPARAVLGSAGVMAANMHPDHAILYRAEALD